MDDKSLHYEIKDIDLIAREFKYHQHCYREFRRPIKRKSDETERSYSQQGDYLKVKEIIGCIATVPETYEDLAWSLIKMVPKNYPWVDIVADTYRNSSLKNQERNRRGISEKVMISSSKSKIPRDFTNFLANNENKNNMILTIFEVYEDNRAKTLNVVKTNELILSGDIQCFKITLSVVYAMDELSSNQEEADTKVTLHAFSILKNINPEKYVIIRSHSGDIDINIIATSLLVTYSGNVYIDYGIASSRKGIHLSELNLTNSEKESLLGMHAFSGNGFMSSFFRKSKVHCWEIMKTSDEFEEAFELLGNSKGCHDTLLECLEKYICKL